jgi:prepilin-type N-terminal cleavage/methylation domain-containing protein
VSRRADDRYGFTLIEMLIAVTIAALLLTATMRFFAASLAGATRTDNYAQATLLAQSKLEAMGGLIVTSLQPASGTEGSFRWQTSIHRYGEAGQRSTFLVPYEVGVNVSWRETGRTRSLSLNTIRLGPQ